MPSMDVSLPSMQLRSGHHQNHMEELTSEPTVADCVFNTSGKLYLPGAQSPWLEVHQRDRGPTTQCAQDEWSFV